ncbi:tRNA (adenosine(37)-N6)-threonylcarbamoyltransferase complex ATPase subunit type 1 TsaE [Collibacillus ludicampi]|jgi:tRNA threonylcarbamoyladenosine biosynthesis protein TsaE|uniref:tRNA threonylcarbamoyladenosine biosynthesis protein TsaE n=1 Tax=Collibacillus ludicampi TaxID=2771369 RepID=A0AAV4LEP0_9BACL|nr:tRNA (adenosine(37)-N6)-threonylcarbamoyltransferase complex ATPase subunit type 1 TsaE [Collibacillus ludicampi]GIM46300.1 tRNA (adenosine(37)-N6)-threonylcarbamoyltransferase complex ATPase subunit type 1 TsaE [Collibacillus ludicampi]
MWTLIAEDAEKTQRFAEILGELAKPGDVLTLHGDLGAGKTTFTQGLARGLGVGQSVSSPTFTLIHEYEGRIPLYHIDVYRLGKHAAEEDLGYDEYFYGEGVTVVEWAELIEERLPDDYLSLTLEKNGEHRRTLHFVARGPRASEWVEEMMKRCRT